MKGRGRCMVQVPACTWSWHVDIGIGVHFTVVKEGSSEPKRKISRDQKRDPRVMPPFGRLLEECETDRQTGETRAETENIRLLCTFYCFYLVGGSW